MEKESPAAKREHLFEIDFIRAITVFSVVAIHSLSYTSYLTTSSKGTQLLNLFIHLLHYNREIFMFVTALVLTYVYMPRTFSSKSFWQKRTLVILVPYILWSVIYTILNNHGLPVLGYVEKSLLNVLTGDASFQLYYILLSLQFYILFPLFLPWIRKVQNRPWTVLTVSAILQLLTVFIDFHYIQSGPLAKTDFANVWNSYHNRFFFIYQFFFVLGAYTAIYLSRLQQFVQKHWTALSFFFVTTIGVYSYFYFFQLNSLHLPLDLATSVIQPSVDLYSIVVIAFFCLLAVTWAKKRPANRLVQVISQTSFGIYFVHVLLLSWVTTLFLPRIPTFVPVPIQDISVILLVFATAVFLCWVLLQTRWLSWTIGKTQKKSA